MDGGSETSGGGRRRRGKRREELRRFECLSPRSLLSRWFSSSEEKEVKVRRESRREGVGREVARVGCSMEGLNGESSSCVLGVRRESQSNEASGQHRKDDCFNVALGFGLFYLLAASKNEVTKMIELRKELEMLLQNAKEKLQSQNRAILSKPSESNVISTCSTFDVQESLISNGSVSLQSQFFFKNRVDSETPELCDHSITCKTSRQENCIQGIDQLEAELEAELERMQIHMDTGDNLEYTKQHKVEVPVEDTTPGQSLDTNLGEAFHCPEATVEHFGVPPEELERRLHEVLALRQEERIKELEAGLECANKKLLEKEREVCWWKDTAKLISEHVPSTSR
ncbi:hypothetical protein RHMOL_Rhmol02G0265600 [Rhododendron molle]|uniref:Uncharacterized protein n=1 Tax=Rhododendron molle TaxID=49168 RepID=A0ACC0PW76_RHOML|nr:hypothetical protein RHMOL_Rhmol02G0265600 [Rhododendron molle]